MHPHLVVPFPLLQSADDDDESPSDSSHSTPRSSFVTNPSVSPHDDDSRRRPYSLLSFDWGYFGIESPVSGSFNRKRSTLDMRHPLVPLNSDPDAMQGSPRREGSIKTFLRKTKKSFSSPSPTEFEPFPMTLANRIRGSEPITHITPFLLQSSTRDRRRDASQERDPCEQADTFEEQDRFAIRRGMKHHPYPRDHAPYMLAYDRMLLDNDKFSELLLQRLNPNHSPSFHDFSHAPPRTVLDLGCGPGGWAVEAATFWPSAQIIGFDLINPVNLRGGVDTPSNVEWKQGNFVKYKLPFPKNMFDLVRMANLSLCVPQERWEHVLSEARRVLAQGGRLEVIDDYVYFPYGKRPSQPPAPSHASPKVKPSISSFDSDGDDESEEEPDALQRDDDDDDDDDDKDFVSAKSRPCSYLDANDVSYDPVFEWDQNVENSKALEKVFEDMLSQKFSVNPWPSKSFDQVLDKVFGRYHQCRLHDFNLYLAPPSGKDADGSSVGSSDSQGSANIKKVGKEFAKWVTTVDWDHQKEKKQGTKGDRSSEESLLRLSIVPETISAKAAGRLGIKPSPPRTPTAQSPGLILWPATFIPLAPFELEMHACKHLHSLIGCKAALTGYLQDIARERNLSFDEQMLDDLIWDYESFRRRRFNWPSECPDARLDSEDTDPATPRPNTSRNSGEGYHLARPRTADGGMSPPLDPLYPRDKLDFVRSIRVYSATKVDEEIHVPS